MFSTQEILKKQQLEEQLTAGKVTLVTTAVTAVATIPNKNIDLIIDDYKHLTGGINDRMSGWYAKIIRQRGIEYFIKQAKIAEKEGKNPARYLSWLLKNN